MANEVQAKDEKSEEITNSGKDDKNSKKKLIIILLPLILILGGAVGIYFSGLSEKLFGKLKPEEKEAGEKVVEEVSPKDVADLEGKIKINPNLAFYDLPEMLVNINTNTRRQSYLKTVITIELQDGTQIPKLEAVLPRVIDTFQVYLRELRIEDLQGSAGMYRLKEELLDRLNKAAYPVQINDVLFKEMLVQ